MSDKPPLPPDEQAAVERRIAHHREQIDALDVRLVEVLNQRALQAREIGRLKDTIGLEMYQPQREVVVLQHARDANHGPLDGDAVTRLFERIIDEIRRFERLNRQNDK